MAAGTTQNRTTVHTALAGLPTRAGITRARPGPIITGGINNNRLDTSPTRGEVVLKMAIEAETSAEFTAQVRTLLCRAHDLCGDDPAPLNCLMKIAKLRHMTFVEDLEFAVGSLEQRPPNLCHLTLDKGAPLKRRSLLIAFLLVFLTVLHPAFAGLAPALHFQSEQGAQQHCPKDASV